MVTAGGRGDCKCMESNGNIQAGIKLTDLLDGEKYPIALYPYENKKAQGCASQIATLLTKIK